MTVDTLELLMQWQDELFALYDKMLVETDPLVQMDLLAEMDSVLERILGENVGLSATSSTSPDTLEFEQWRNGDFSQLELSKFKAKLRELAELGLSIPDAVQGVRAWFAFDSSRNTLAN